MASTVDFLQARPFAQGGMAGGPSMTNPYEAIMQQTMSAISKFRGANPRAGGGWRPQANNQQTLGMGVEASPSPYQYDFGFQGLTQGGTQRPAAQQAQTVRSTFSG